MAANPIVIAKANQLFPEINFGFMTWIQGSIVPSLFCAICIPLIIRWSLGLNTDTPTRGKHARGGENVIQHAQMELHKMGPVSVKEWVGISVLVRGKILIISIATVCSAVGMSRFVGNIYNDPLGLYTGCIAWHCCFVTYGHHYVEGCVEQYKCSK